MERGLGALAAVITWLAWLAICPVLGFPTVSTGAMVNRMISANIPEAGHNPGYWMGWVVVIAGLLVAIAAFIAVERAQLAGTNIRTGLIYGAALWLFTGLVIMPLIGLAEPATPLPAKLDPMHATVMMYTLGPLAALAALIAWLLFGAILGAAAHARQ
jgi:hypothetical protein